MRRPRLWHKLGAIAFAFAVPVSVTTWFLVDEQRIKIDFAENELRGVTYVQPLRDLVELLVRRRSEPSSTATGVTPTARGDLDELVDAAFARLRSLDRRLGRKLQTDAASLAGLGKSSSSPAELARTWSRVRADRVDHPAWHDRHSRLIADVRRLISHVGDTSQLILDPDVDTYYLMDAFLLEEPRIVDNVGILRDTVHSLLAGGRVESKDQIAVAVSTSALDRDSAALLKAVATALDHRSGSSTPSLEGALRPLLNDTYARLHALVLITDARIVRSATVAGLEEFTRTERAATAANSRLWAALLEAEDRLLNARRAGDLRRQRISLLSVFFILMVTVATTAAVARRITRDTSSMAAAASAVADGDLTRRATVRSRDEIGQLADAFNRMTDRLGAMVATERDHGAALERDAERLRLSEEATRRVIESANDAFIAIDAGGTIVDWSPASVKLFGWSTEEAIGRPLVSLLIPTELRPSHLAGLKRFLETGEKRVIGQTLELPALDKAGHRRTVEITIWAHRARDAWMFNAFLRDISERKRIESELERLALHDSLTGLPNRALFGDRLEGAIAHANRTEEPLAVAMVDVDGFKVVNDTLGHQAGDELLLAVCERLASCARATDTVARLGGDEFAIVMPDTTIGGATEVAERLLERMRSPLLLEGREVVPYVSVGIASASPGTGSDELLSNADVAMYSAKQQGGGAYRLHAPEMETAVLQRLEIGAALRRAVDLEQLVLAYQPIVSMRSGEVMGAEALLRWDRGDGEIVQPDTFIDIAEQTGSIVPIGRWVLDRACRDAAGWTVGSGDGRYVSVNISPRQLHDPGIVDVVAHALEASGLPPELLTLEVTETAIVGGLEPAIAQLTRLRDLGLHVAIDDFGTGYSSLTYLRRLPVDVVKIDRSFIGGIAEHSGEWSLAVAIVGLVRSLKLAIIAEGVETAAQLAHTRALGCDYAQGYYFAKPCPDEELALILRSAPPPGALH